MPKRKKSPWFLRFAVGASAVAILVAAFAYMLARDPHPGLEQRLPSGCGAKGPDFEITCLDGMPYLVSGGLPYPTGYDSADHPRQSLNGQWLMRFDTAGMGEASGWQQGNWEDAEALNVEVPSTYNAPAGRFRGHQGIVWSARRFRSELDPGSGWIRLCFQGVLLRSTVWLNGVRLGGREGGYTPFYFDATPLLRSDGENVLVVRSDNRLEYGSLPPRVRPRHNPVWGVYGGIYRDVYMEAIPERYLLNARVQPYRDTVGAGFSADLLVHGKPESPACTLSLSLRDPLGRVVAQADTALVAGGPKALRKRLSLEQIHSWGPGSPQLYTLEMRLRGPGGSESLWVKIGHRLLTTEGPGLNMDGRRLFLKGISKMEDDPVLGQTQNDSVMDRDWGLIRDMGANYVRLAHYPHHDREARLARDMGIMVGEEIPFFHVGEGWSQWLVDFQGMGGFPFSTFGMKHLHREELLLQAQKSLAELIIRDGNNPAVLLWCLGNESYSLNSRAGRFYGWLRETALAFDPSRPVTMAEMTYYLPWLDDRRASPRFLDVASINMYYGWYFGEVSGAGGHLDRFHARYPGSGVLLSEFGAEAALGRSDGDGIRTGDRVYFPRTYSEEYQAALLETHVRAALNRPYVIGVSPWCFADFYCPWFPHNPVPEYNTKGVMTRERAPKQGYFALQKLYRSLPDFRDEAATRP